MTLCPLLGNIVYNVVNQLLTSMFEFKMTPIHNFISMVQDLESLNKTYKHINSHVENCVRNGNCFDK